ncbi:hypothetical protein HD806DRAFT_318493 [Xylariaceae sp. AK1471]|nr:hypothetical protein HD806DRAFT_318493 [Xylariaceae sp. AK1471]
MRSLTSSIPLALAAVAIAAPSVFKRETRCPDSDKYSGAWCSGIKADNVDIRVSDKKTDYGTVNPGDLIKSVREHCSDNICEGGSWSLPSMWITNPDGDENDKGLIKGEIVVKFPTALGDPVHLDPMLDALQFTLDRLKDFTVDERKRQTTCGSSGCSSYGGEKLEHTKGPSKITIELRDDNAGDKSIYDKPLIDALTLVFEQKKEDDDLSGLCSTIIGAGAGIAGGVNPVLGALGALGALGCM